MTRHECGGVFVFIGADADTAWLPQQVARDRNGYLLTGDEVLESGRWSHTRDPFLLESSLPGVFACGDVRLSPIKRVAVGEGSMAIAFVHQCLAREGRQADAFAAPASGRANDGAAQPHARQALRHPATPSSTR